MRKIIQFLVKVYLWFRKLFDRPNFEQLPENMRKMTIIRYGLTLLKYPYKSDRLKGLLDKTESIEHFLDKSVTSDRDCDDFARMWSAWLIHNGYKSYEVVLVNPKVPKANHVITIGEKDGRFYLFDYVLKGVYSSFDKALAAEGATSLLYYKAINVVYRTFDPIESEVKK